MSQYPNPRPSSSNEKMGGYVQDLQKQKIRLVRKTPLKARNLQPPKPIRKSKVAIQTHFIELISNETTPNEHSEAKDVHETSNSPSFDCQDTDPRPTGQDPIQDEGPIRDTKDSEIEDLDVQEDVNDNSESKVEHGHSSRGNALVDIVDAPPEKNVELELSEPLVILLLDLLEEKLIMGDEESGVNLVKVRDILKDALAISKDNLGAASPQLSLASPGESANLHEEKEQLLHEILETMQKTTGIVKKYRDLFPYRLSEDYEDEEIEEEWNGEEHEEGYEKKHKEERDGDRYSFPTFLANYLLFAAIILIFILPAIVFQSLEHPNSNGFMHAILSWLNSTLNQTAT